jgi:hypothetical protein
VGTGYSLVVLWLETVGREWVRCPHRPWYPRKPEPWLQDMVTILRRKSW